MALAVRVAAAVRLSPASDVFYYLSQAVQVLLSGANPYEHAYTGIPPSLITPGAQQVFAYLPFTILYLVPFYLAGDVRLGLIAADLAVGACLYLYGGRWHLGAAVLYLFVPFTVLFSTFYVNAALIAMGFVAAFLLLESKGRGGRPAAVSFGLALATAQFAALIAPFVFVYYAKKKKWVELATAAAVAGAVIVPFLLASPSFLNETILFQFQRPVAPLFTSGGPLGVLLNPTLAALSVSIFGFAAPVYAKAAVEVVLLAFLVRVTDLSNLSRNSAIFVVVSVFVLPNNFFWVYLELPFMLALFWLSAPKNLAFVKRR